MRQIVNTLSLQIRSVKVGVLLKHFPDFLKFVYDMFETEFVDKHIKSFNCILYVSHFETLLIDVINYLSQEIKNLFFVTKSIKNNILYL